MTDVKYCKRCGLKISDVDVADWYSHLSIKYCRPCAEVVKREQTLERVHRLRQRKKIKDKYRDEQLELLRQQTELMQEKIKLLENGNLRLREQLEKGG